MKYKEEVWGIKNNSIFPIKKMKKQLKWILVFIGIYLSINTVYAQSEEQLAMAKLSFMIGDWKGEGTSYPKAENKKYDVLSKVRYDLDGTLLVLKHRSTRAEQPVLSLHTIIYYNKKEKVYYYYPFTEKGVRPFKGNIVDGKFICTIGDSYRLIFQRTKEGFFNEYGEKLVNNTWEKNFEDKLLPTSEITF